MHDRNAGLDPETQFVEIYRNLGTYDFAWDLNQSLSFALFRTYAVPSIGRLLDETGEFERATQRRYDDTSLLLEVPLLEGFESPRARAAIRRINQMHRMYDIPNDDMRYVLSTFVVVPVRWLHAFGWRPLTPDERLASVRYYQSLGRHMGITDIPETYAEFATLMDDYERAHFVYDVASARVADRTLALLVSFYPRLFAPVVEVFSRALMDPPLLRAFGYRDPGRIARRLSAGALRLRARAVAVLPKRRTPLHVIDLPRIRSHPNGFDIEQMGTFAPGCPVPHAKR
ncbi:oxygenase MpaB family protein [Microbacterium sp. NPDC058062]|uniref:oxygenase MpaB family protein n=1 Tax=Microbacterium sp. NPDC058062 TaxID=3346320 RepID=UPI0036DF400D